MHIVEKKKNFGQNLNTLDEDSRKWFMHIKKDEFVSNIDGLEDNTHLMYEDAVKMVWQ